MFKAVKKSAFSLFRKGKKRTKISSFTRRPLEPSDSASLSSWDHCSRRAESSSSKVREPVKNHAFEAASFVGSEDASSQATSVRLETSHGPAGQRKPSITPTQFTLPGINEGSTASVNSVDEFMAQDPWADESLKLVDMTYEGRKRQTLLLNVKVLEWLQAIAQRRRQSHELETPIGTMTRRVEDRMKAGIDISVLRVPAAFPEDEEDSEAEQGLMLAFRKTLSIQNPAVEELKAQRAILTSKLEQLQKLLLADLAQAVEEGGT